MQIEYPRVTEIIRPFTPYDKIPNEVMERAAARGTSVHAICAAIAKGVWIPDGMINPEHLGYVNSFREWAKQVEEFSIVEKRYIDKIRRFTGQLDFVVKIAGEMWLVDLKTSAKPQKTHPVQMGAYKLLLQEHQVEVKGAILVYLHKDGEQPLVQTIEDLEPETAVFEAALSCWHYFNQGSINVRKNATVTA